MVFQKRTSGSRPLPLKQRTSSKDTRRDYSHKTWSSLLVLLKFREYLITVDNFSIWRRHLAWAMENGKDLKTYMTQRYASNMVFMSLMLSTELGVLFNSAHVTTEVRQQLMEGNHNTISFWAGFMIIVSSLLTLTSLFATFTAWSMVNAVDENNAHCIFRSSIGQYVAELPGRLIVCSIYSFIITFMIFFFLLLPVGPWSVVLLISAVALFAHIVQSFSAFGRVIMHTGAMGKNRIFTPEYEELLLPHTLHSNLLLKAQANLANNTSIIRQYRRKQNPIGRFLTEDEMYDHLSCRERPAAAEAADDVPIRSRADSTVRFADEDIGKMPQPSPATRQFSPVVETNSMRSDISSIRRPSDMSYDRSMPFGNEPYNPRRSSGHRPPTSIYRPPLPTPSPIPPPPDLTLRNVSTSSLEQWLQRSQQVPENNNQEKSQASIPSGPTPFQTPRQQVHQNQTTTNVGARPQAMQTRSTSSGVRASSTGSKDSSDNDSAIGPPQGISQQPDMAIRNVSSSSLEQWLQASPQVPDDDPQKAQAPIPGGPTSFPSPQALVHQTEATTSLGARPRPMQMRSTSSGVRDSISTLKDSSGNEDSGRSTPGPFQPLPPGANQNYANPGGRPKPMKLRSTSKGVRNGDVDAELSPSNENYGRLPHGSLTASDPSTFQPQRQIPVQVLTSPGPRPRSLQPRSSPTGMSESTTSLRDLSEDERFNLDYGDFIDAENKQDSSPNSRNSDADYAVVDYFDSERASLLGGHHNTPRNHYGYNSNFSGQDQPSSQN